MKSRTFSARGRNSDEATNCGSEFGTSTIRQLACEFKDRFRTSHTFEANVSQQSKVGIRISMPRKPTSPSTRYPGVDPSRGQAQPDAGARKAAKKVRDLNAMAKKFPPLELDSGRIATMSTRELIATLEELVRAEAFYLSRSKDPRPVQVDKPIGNGFTLRFRRWRPGTDPLPVVQGWAERLGTDPGKILRALAERPGTATATILRDLAERLGKDPATVLQDMEASNRRPNERSAPTETQGTTSTR